MTQESNVSNPIRDRIAEVIERGDDLDIALLTDRIVAAFGHVPITVTLALVNRVEALEDALRRLADAAYPLADHERAYPAGSQDIVIQGRRLGPDDGIDNVTVPRLRELAEAIEQAEEAFWPCSAIDVAPELADGR